MSEYNPEAPVKLQFSNREVELHKDRTVAYTHRQLGHRALNHLWLTDTDENGKDYGFYIWFDQFGLNDEERQNFFGQTLQAMLNYDYQMILNVPEPSETDIESYIEYQSRDLDQELNQ